MSDLFTFIGACSPHHSICWILQYYAGSLQVWRSSFELQWQARALWRSQECGGHHETEGKLCLLTYLPIGSYQSHHVWILLPFQSTVSIMQWAIHSSEQIQHLRISICIILSCQWLSFSRAVYLQLCSYVECSTTCTRWYFLVLPCEIAWAILEFDSLVSIFGGISSFYHVR